LSAAALSAAALSAAALSAAATAAAAALAAAALSAAALPPAALPGCCLVCFARHEAELSTSQYCLLLCKGFCRFLLFRFSGSLLLQNSISPTEGELLIRFLIFSKNRSSNLL
jgi:hypothetical protein